MATFKANLSFLRELFALKEVMDAGQIQGAARRNGIKQSNLSKIISDLETELNTPLLNRSSKGVEPTNTARLLYTDIESIVKSLDKISAEFSDAEELTGCVTVFVEDGFLGSRLLKEMSLFYAMYLNIRLDIVTDKHVSLSDVDLAIFSDIPSDIKGKILFKSESKMHLYSSESYLARHGVPKNMADLLENFDLCVQQRHLEDEFSRLLLKKSKTSEYDIRFGIGHFQAGLFGGRRRIAARLAGARQNESGLFEGVRFRSDKNVFLRLQSRRRKNSENKSSDSASAGVKRNRRRRRFGVFLILTASKKSPAQGGTFGKVSPKLTGIEFDDQIRFHLYGVRNVGEFGNADERALARFGIDFHIVGNFTFGRSGGFDNASQFAGFFLDGNDIAGFDQIGRDVHAFAVDHDVAVVDELTRSENGRNEFHTINDGVQTRFQQTDQVFGRVAAAADSFGVVFAHLFFGNVAVVGFQFLFSQQLRAVVGRFAFVLTVLTRTVFAAVNRAFRATPQIQSQAAVDFEFRCQAF